MNGDNVVEFILTDIDPRTWAKIEKRASKLGISPEEVAQIFLEKSLGPSC